MSNRPANLETDPLFPSGPWIGFFLQGRRFPMRLNLLFHDGVMEGAGRDAQVGDFHIHGDYSTTSGKCHCTKIYPHRPQVMHHVHYTGYNEGKGIWGVWEIAAFEGYPALHGGFYIWPEGWPDPTVGISTTENELPNQQPEVPSLDESLQPQLFLPDS